MSPRFLAAVERITGAAPQKVSRLRGGCVGEVYHLCFADGGELVAKVGGKGSGLEVEGASLRYLKSRSRLPVPSVVHESEELLLIEYIPTSGGLTAAAEAHAADLLADLHGIHGEAFGFDRDTRIGGLRQPNPRASSWRDFFRDHRLLYMAGEARSAGRLPASLLPRIEALAGRLERWLGEPPHPALIHGDVWSGNLLCREGRIVGFIDPAIHYADPEIELAFSTLFATFGDAFFSRYRERRPLRPGFFEERRDLYNLYPLLVHVRLFGGAYVASVERTLARYGC